MSDRESSEDESEASTSGFSLVRAAKIAAIVFSLLLGAIAITALMTDGAPDAPFDYGELR